eukprot:gene27667-31259_t
MGILDTALAYSSEHKVLLQHQANWIWNPERLIYLNSHSLKWARRRKIIVTRCKVDPHSMTEIGPAAFMFLCSVKSLAVINFTDANLLDQILGCIESVDDRSLHHLMQYCPHLSSFSLGRGSYCSYIQIAGFLRQMSHLRTLNLSGVCDAVGSDISDHCKSLTSLSLIQCCRITEEVLATIVRQCDQLTTLDVSGTRFSDTALFALAESCPQLTELHLDACSPSHSLLQ